MIIAGTTYRKTKILLESNDHNDVHVVRIYVNGIMLQTKVDSSEAGHALVLRLASDLGISVDVEDGS